MFLSSSHVGPRPDEYFSSSLFVFVEFLVTSEIILYDLNHSRLRFGFGMNIKQTLDCTLLFENICAEISCILKEQIIIAANL